MTITEARAVQSLTKAKMFFIPLVALQLVL